MMTSLSDAIRVYLQQPRAKATAEQYGFVLKRLLQHMDGNIDVTTITYFTLLDYVDSMRNSLSKKNIPYKDVTINTHINTLKGLFTWCVEAGLIEHSPAAKLKTPTIKPNTEAHAIPEEELMRMIDYERWNPRNYAMLLFLADTGCRAGGCESLRIGKLDLDKGEAILHEKGGRIHKALFGEETAAALRAWLEVRPKVAHDFVWTGQGPDYKPMKRGGIAFVVKRAAQATKASKAWGPHSIRHYVGHKWAKAGVPVTMIQLKLGHANPTVTMAHYMPHDEGYLKKLTDELSLRGDSLPLDDKPSDKIIQIKDWKSG